MGPIRISSVKHVPHIVARNNSIVLRYILRPVRRPEHELPVFSSVWAANTSKYHYGCGGVVNRHASANFGVCSRCKKIVDCHLNAAQEIAARHLNFTQEAGPPQTPPAE